MTSEAILAQVIPPMSLAAFDPSLPNLPLFSCAHSMRLTR